MVLFAFQESVSIMPDGTIFIHIALILLMIWILNRTFFRPVNRVIEEREKNSGGRFTESEEILRDVEAKNERYNQQLLEARSESYDLIETERREAVLQREAEISRVKAEVEQRTAAEFTELETQTAQAEAQIAEEAKIMADKITRNILKTA